jgi:hypothetical protein
MALLASCGSNDKQEPVSTPAWPQDKWQVEYTRSGGIAGISERLALESNGTVVTENRRTGRTLQAYVVPSDVAMVQALLRASNLPALKSDQGLPVPDAILTSIKVTSGDKAYGATFNRTPEPGEVAALLRRLGALYDAFKP